MISPFLNVFYSLCFSHLYLPTCSVFASSISLKNILILERRKYKMNTRHKVCIGQLLLVMKPTLECIEYSQLYSIEQN